MKHTAKNLKQRNIVGHALRKKRLQAKPPITQEDLAGKLAAKGILLDRSAISRIENQSRYLMDYELIAIAKALKITLDSLIKD